jgi:hypothetical protein
MSKLLLSLAFLPLLAATSSAQKVVRAEKFAPDAYEDFNGSGCHMESGTFVSTPFGYIETEGDALRRLCMLAAGDGCNVYGKSHTRFIGKLSTELGGVSALRIHILEPARSFGGLLNQDYPEGSLSVSLFDQDGALVHQETTAPRTSCGWHWYGWRTNGATRISSVEIRLQGRSSLALENLQVGYDEPGTDYCQPTVPNSIGELGALHFEGTERFSDPLAFRTTGLPHDSAGVLLVGRALDFGTQPFGSQALVCVGGVTGTVPLGGFEAQLDGSRSLLPAANLLPTRPIETEILPGETWYFQVWYRDANPLPTSNATNAVFVTFE